MTRTVALAPAGRGARAALGYLGAVLWSAVTSIYQAASAHAERRRCIDYLMNCDHRMLNDIGIDRSMIRRMVWGQDHRCR